MAVGMREIVTCERRISRVRSRILIRLSDLCILLIIVILWEKKILEKETKYDAK